MTSKFLKMKNFILLSALLITAIFHAQQTKFNLNHLSETDAMDFAAQIAKNSQTKWEFFQVKDNSRTKYFVVEYINSELPKDRKNEVKNGDVCESCMSVVFTKHQYSETSEKWLKFYNVSADYLDIFPTWKNVFKPDADFDKKPTDYDSQQSSNNSERSNYKLSQNGNFWTITNWSI